MQLCILHEVGGETISRKSDVHSRVTQGAKQLKKDISDDDNESQCNDERDEESEENMRVPDAYMVVLILDFVHSSPPCVPGDLKAPTIRIVERGKLSASPPSRAA